MNSLRPPERAEGFTLLELVVVVCLVGLLASVALDRYLRYEEIAEKTVMEGTIAAARGALTMQSAVRIAGGGFAALKGLDQQNPMEWLARTPPGYLGALYDPPLSDVPPGSWYFDLKNKELVYRPQRTRFLLSRDEPLRWHVVLRIVENGSSGVRELAELDVRPTRPIQWAPEF